MWHAFCVAFGEMCFRRPEPRTFPKTLDFESDAASSSSCIWVLGHLILDDSSRRLAKPGEFYYLFVVRGFVDGLSWDLGNVWAVLALPTAASC